MRFSLLLLVILCCESRIVLAQQNDSLLSKNNVFDVVKTFKPILSEALKIPINPSPEKTADKRPDFKYDLPSQLMKIEPNIYTIKPLGVGTTLLPKLKNNYTKLGFGNYATPLFEVYLNSVRNKKLQACFFAKHLSSSGEQKYNSFSNNSLSGSIKRFYSKQEIGAEALYERNKVNLYGYPSGFPENQLNDPGILYQLIQVKGHVSSLKSDSGVLSHFTEACFAGFTSNRQMSDNDFSLKTQLRAFVNALPLELQAALRFNTITFDQLKVKRIFFDLNPELRLPAEGYYLKGGFNSTVASDSTSSKFYFFPKAEAGLDVVKSKLVLFAGITGKFTPNTLRSINSENPFALASTNDLGSTPGILNTINHFDIYGGFKGELSPFTSFIIQSSSSRIENMLFYGYDSAHVNQVTVYETGTATLTRLSFALNHGLGDKLRIGLSGRINNYSLKTLKNPYSRPEFELKLNGIYNIGNKFYTKLDVFMIGARQSLILGMNGSHEAQLSSYVDANLGVDYRYSPSVSVFLQFNNISNNPYQRWYQYPVYGFNALGGFTFTF